MLGFCVGFMHVMSVLSVCGGVMYWFVLVGVGCMCWVSVLGVCVGVMCLCYSSVFCVDVWVGVL